MGHVLFPIAFAAVVAVAYQLLESFVSIPDDRVGVEELGKPANEPQIVATGQPGIQPRLLDRGTHFTFWRRRIRLQPLVVVPEGCVGVVTAHIGRNVPGVAAYNPQFLMYEDVEAFLRHGGRQGVQEAVLPPGTYAIHPDAFEVSIIDDGTVTFYGRRSPTSTLLGRAEAYTVVADDDALLIVMEPNNTTLAVRMATDDTTGNYRSVVAMTSPVGGVTIEWEIALRDGTLPCEEQIRSELADLAGAQFEGKSWTVADFVTAVEALDAEAHGNYYARVTEAVMRPKLISPYGVEC